MVPQPGQIIMLSKVAHLLPCPQQLTFLPQQVFRPVLHGQFQLTLLLGQHSDAPPPGHHHHQRRRQHKAKAQNAPLPPPWRYQEADLGNRGYRPGRPIHRHRLETIAPRLQARIPHAPVGRLHPVRLQAQQPIANPQVPRIAKAQSRH